MPRADSIIHPHLDSDELITHILSKEKGASG